MVFDTEDQVLFDIVVVIGVVVNVVVVALLVVANKCYSEASEGC